MALVVGTNCGCVTVAPTADPGGSGFPIDTSRCVMKITIPAGYTRIIEVGAYIENATGEANWRTALYAADGGTVPGEAGTRLYHEATNAKGTDAGWKTRASLAWDVTAETDYWVAFSCDDTATTTNIDSATSGGPGVDSIGGSSALGDPFGGGALLDADGMFAIYALVEAASGAVSAAGYQAYYHNLVVEG